MSPWVSRKGTGAGLGVGLFGVPGARAKDGERRGRARLPWGRDAWVLLGGGGGPTEPRDWRLLRLFIGCAARPLAHPGPMHASAGRALVLRLPSVGVAGMRRREQPP